MVSIIQERILLVFFIILPWFTAIKYHFGNTSLYVFIIGAIVTIIALNLKKVNYAPFFDIKNLLFNLIIINLILIFIYQFIFYNVNYYFYILYFGINIITIYLYLTISPACKKLLNLHYSNLTHYYFLLNVFFIILDFILLKTDNIDLQLMYGTYATGENATRDNNLIRPLGLYGQATVNAVLVIFHYSLMLAIDNKRHFLSKGRKILYFIFLIIAIALQGSGTGVVMLFLFALLYILYSKRFTLLFFGSLILMLIIYIFSQLTLEVDSIILQKISADGIQMISLYFYSELLSYINYAASFIEVFFGVNGNVNLERIGELGSLKIIYRMGFVFFLLFGLLYLFLITSTRNIFYKISLFIALIGSNHYDAMFWTYSMAFFLGMIYFDILFNKEKVLSNRMV